jgi:thioredoxin-like negative regulator of GroEL
MIEIDDSSGPEALKNGKCVLVFYTGWCPRCPPVISALLSLEEKHRGQFTAAKIDFDSNPEAAAFLIFPGFPPF